MTTASSLQLYMPPSAHPLAMQDTPSPTLSASNRLRPFLAMSREEIYQNGIPPASVYALVESLEQGIANRASRLSLHNDTAWAFAEETSLLVTPLSPLPPLKMTFFPMTNPNFWTGTVQDYQMTLQSLHRLYYAINFPPDDLTKQLLIHWIDCLLERIAQKCPPGDLRYFVMKLGIEGEANNAHFPLRAEVLKYKRALCLKTEESWKIGVFDDFPNLPIDIVQFDSNCTQMLVFDGPKQFMDRPCTIIRSRMYPEDENAQPKPNHLKVEIICYRGSGELMQGKNNATTFTFDINRAVIPHQMENFQQVISDLDPTSRVSPQQLETMRELAENFFQTMPALSSVQLYTNPLMVDVTPPQSPSDKCVVLTELLRTLNPDEDPDVICEIAGLIGCDFSRQEMRQLLHNRQANKTKDGYDISPEAVINKMRKTLGAKLVQFTTAKLTYDRTAPTKPEASKTGKPTLETKTAPPPSVTEAEFAQQTRQMEQHRLEKELQKTRRREEFAFEQKKEIARIQGAQQTAASTQDFSMLGLSEKDLARVKDIYKGKVQNAKNFATFAMGLLRKKVAAMGASAKTHTKGSHPKIHFKRKDGESSGGVTFSIHHGGDKHGSLPVQKDTLTRILAI